MTLAAMATGLRADITPGPKADGKSESSHIKVAAPDGFCAFDPDADTSASVKTGFEPGIERSTILIALYLPCQQLAAHAPTTHQIWLPEWLAYETNIVTFPEDDERMIGVRGSVSLLCNDARGGHPQVAGATFADRVEASHTMLSPKRPIIWLGVVAEEQGACYLASLRLLQGEPGEYRRLLTVTAFMMANEKWVYQSVRGRAATREESTSLLDRSTRATQTFLANNPD